MDRIGIFATLAILVLVSTVGAGEYRIYRDSEGQVVISNVKPPLEASTIASYDLGDVTWEEVRQAQRKSEEMYRVSLRIEELERRNNELVEQIQRLKMAQLYVPPQPRTVVISTVRTLRRKEHTRAHRWKRRTGKAVSIHRPHLPRDRRSLRWRSRSGLGPRDHTARSGHTHR